MTDTWAKFATTKTARTKKQNQTKTSEAPITGKTVQVEADNRNSYPNLPPDMHVKSKARVQFESH